MRNPGTAAVLSFLVPGLGQLYNGTWVRAILWFVAWLFFGPGLFVFTGGISGLVMRALAAVTAYSYAKSHPHREFS